MVLHSPFSYYDSHASHRNKGSYFQTKDREVDFDVEIAIKVCRQASSEDALMLAKKHGMHDWYLKIQLEDRGKYREALEYISSLEFEDVSKIQ